MDKKDVIGEAAMQQFAKEIANIIGMDAILAIDLFSVSHYLNERTISYNYGRPVYIDEILPGFLNEKGSIGLIDEPIDEGHTIGGNLPSELKKQPLKYKHNEDFQFKGNCEFGDYISYLEEKRFGSYCLWLNDFIKDEYEDDNFKTNVSVLLVLDIVPDESQLAKLRALTYKKLFGKGFRITVKEFMRMYRQVSDQEKFFKALDADKQHFGHTIQNIFPQGLSNVNAVLNELDKNGIEYKKLLYAKKDLTMSKAIFQSISGQEIRELSDKSVLHVLEFIRDNSTSRHFVDLDLKQAAAYRTTKVPDSSIGNVVLILWNFFHNATKYSGSQELQDVSTVSIRAFELDGFLVISFKNRGTTSIKTKTKEFLCGDRVEADPADQKGGKGGLEIAKRRLNMLNWRITFPEVTPGELEKIDVYGVKMERQYFVTDILLKTDIRLL